MTQPALDFTKHIDSHVLHPAEIQRLSAQDARVLARLEQGPCRNFDLAQIALNFTARISDLRKAGFDIRIIERDRSSGRVVYQLFGRKA